MRAQAKDIIGNKDFVEVFIDTPLEECERRDVKGLYKKARAGEIPEFTGISAPYEAPAHADIQIKTSGKEIAESLEELYTQIIKHVQWVQPWWCCRAIASAHQMRLVMALLRKTIV